MITFFLFLYKLWELQQPARKWNSLESILGYVLMTSYCTEIFGFRSGKRRNRSLMLLKGFKIAFPIMHLFYHLRFLLSLFSHWDSHAWLHTAFTTPHCRRSFNYYDIYLYIYKTYDICLYIYYPDVKLI